MKTYRCTGSCRRAGLTQTEINCMPGGGCCPYCTGKVVNEETGADIMSEKPAFPPPFPGLIDLKEGAE